MWGQVIHVTKQPVKKSGLLFHTVTEIEKFRNFDRRETFDPVMESPTVRSSEFEEISDATASSTSRRVRDLLALCFSVSFSIRVLCILFLGGISKASRSMNT